MAFEIISGGKTKEAKELSYADRLARVNNLKVYLRSLENDMAVVNQHAKVLNWKALEKQCSETHRAVLGALRIIKKEQKKLALQSSETKKKTSKNADHIKLIKDNTIDL